MKREIKILINKSEITAGTRGASLGPEAMMVAARKVNNDYFARYRQEEIPHVNHYLDHEIKYPKAKRIAGLLAVFERMSMAVAKSLTDGEFPFVLAGDHGSAGGTIAGIKLAYPTKRLGVIWIDAHADIHTPFTTPSGNMHGMPLATALGLDNREEQKNDPSDEIVALWEALKNVGIDGPKIEASDLIYIGVRDTEKEEDAITTRLKIVNHKVENVRSEGAAAIAKKCLEQLKECDIIYVSFDVDSMDPAHTSTGTGTPVGNGLLPEEAQELLLSFAAEPRTVCMEFVEINPCLDNQLNRMAEIAFELLENTTERLIKE